MPGSENLSAAGPATDGGADREQRAYRRHRTIVVQSEPYTPAQGRGQGIYARGPLGTQKDVPVPVAPVPDVGGEEGYRYPQVTHAVELVFACGLAVLDPVPVIGPRFVGQGLLVGVQDGTYRGIPISVRPDLPTGFMNLRHHTIQLLLGPYQVVIRRFGLAKIRLPQRRGAYLYRPVLKELHR